MFTLALVLAATLEKVPTRADASQTYTLHLPATYDASKKHPLLFVLDPRGRGTFAANIFREAADEFGWIVISSNNTRSDDDGKANKRAIPALLPEADRYAVDRKRIYAAGFSGTAVLANALGISTGEFAGVIGTGGRVVPEVPAAKFSFPHYGLAGESDFNYREMKELDALLARAGKTHRFTEFAGEHEWFAAPLAREALGWFEVLAMKDGRRTRDEALLAAIHARELEAAAQAGIAPAALARYRTIAATFDGLRDVSAIRETIARLESDKQVQRAIKEEARWLDFERRYADDLLVRVPLLLRNDETRALRIADLKRRAKAAGPEGAAARRMLSALFTQTSFYLVTQLFARKDYALAATSLRTALEIRDDVPHVWYNLGAAYARLGDAQRALDALRNAFARGYKDVAHLAADDDFSAIHNNQEFQELLASRSQ